MPARFSARMRRRQFLLASAGFTATTVLAACSSSSNATNNKSGNSAAPSGSVAPAASAAATVAGTTDLNAKGFPKSISKLSIGLLPSQEVVKEKSAFDPIAKFLGEGLGVPIDTAVTTSYAALVEAQKNKQVNLGYYGAFSFLFAEQQFGAVPVLVDSVDGTHPGFYNSLLLAGKNSPVKTVADIKGKDFTFVDPESTSGNLFPRAMLIKAGIDPNKDLKGRFAGSHENSILAIAKGQVPCGASNNISLQAAIDQGVIQKDDLVILEKSDNIPNGPFAVGPDFDKRAITQLQNVAGQFSDAKVLSDNGLQGKLVPVDTSFYNFVRETAKLLNLHFDAKGNIVQPGEASPTPAH